MSQSAAIRAWQQAEWAREPQAKVFNDPARFRVVVAGRRFGKTVLAINELLRAAMVGTKRNVWYVAPTYRQAKQIAWTDLKSAVPKRMVAHKDETDLSITLKGYGSTIALRGAENADTLRGVGLDFVVLDEFADISEDVWPEIIRPALADRGGEALFIGTPKGFNWAYDTYLHAQTADDWSAWQFTTLEGGNVDQTEIDAARQALSERQFQQEFEASFEQLANRVYDSFDRTKNVAKTHDHGGTLLVGMDFNVDPMSAVVGIRAADQLHVLSEIEIHNGNTEEMALELQRRYPGREVRVYPDPSGKARKTSAPVGQTDFTILQRHGFKVLAPSQAPNVADRVNEVNALLCNGQGERRCFVDPRCKSLMKALDGLTYKDGTSQPDKTLGLDHITDALGYLVHMEFPINQTGFKRTKLKGF